MRNDARIDQLLAPGIGDRQLRVVVRDHVAVLVDGADRRPVERVRPGEGKGSGAADQVDHAPIAGMTADLQLILRHAQADDGGLELAVFDGQPTDHPEQGLEAPRAQHRVAQGAEHGVDATELGDARLLLQAQGHVAIDATITGMPALFVAQRLRRAFQAAQAAVAMTPAQHPVAPAPWAAAAAVGPDALRSGIALFVVQVVQRVLADQVFRRVAEDVGDAAIAVGELAAPVHFPHPVGRALDDAAEALLAGLQGAFHALAFALFPRHPQRALDRRLQAPQVFLQHVVGGTALQRVDGDVLADRAGDEDERNVRRYRRHHAQGILAAESRHRIVAEHDMRGEFAQGPPQTVLVHDAFVLQPPRQRLQRAQDDLRIGRTVFHQQHLQHLMRFVHGKDLIAAPGWRSASTCRPG